MKSVPSTTPQMKFAPVDVDEEYYGRVVVLSLT